MISKIGLGEAALAAAATASALVRFALAAALAAANSFAVMAGAVGVVACAADAPSAAAAAALSAAAAAFATAAALSRAPWPDRSGDRKLRSAWKEAEVTKPRRGVEVPAAAAAGETGWLRAESGKEPAEGDLVILRVILGRALNEAALVMPRIRREPRVSLPAGAPSEPTLPPCAPPPDAGSEARLSDFSMIF